MLELNSIIFESTVFPYFMTVLFIPEHIAIDKILEIAHVHFQIRLSGLSSPECVKSCSE